MVRSFVAQLRQNLPDVVIDRTTLGELVCVLRVQDHEGLTGVVIALVASEDATARQSDQMTLVALGAQLFRLGQLHDFLLVVGVEHEALALRAAIASKDRQHVHEDQAVVPTTWTGTLGHWLSSP